MGNYTIFVNIHQSSKHFGNILQMTSFKIAGEISRYFQSSYFHDKTKFRGARTSVPVCLPNDGYAFSLLTLNFVRWLPYQATSPMSPWRPVHCIWNTKWWLLDYILGVNRFSIFCAWPVWAELVHSLANNTVNFSLSNDRHLNIWITARPKLGIHTNRETDDWE